jgi:hypothetical protein
MFLVLIFGKKQNLSGMYKIISVPLQSTCEIIRHILFRMVQQIRNCGVPDRVIERCTSPEHGYGQRRAFYFPGPSGTYG